MPQSEAKRFHLAERETGHRLNPILPAHDVAAPFLSVQPPPLNYSPSVASLPSVPLTLPSLSLSLAATDLPRQTTPKPTVPNATALDKRGGRSENSAISFCLSVEILV